MPGEVGGVTRPGGLGPQPGVVDEGGAPVINDFGDEDHKQGEVGLIIFGSSFGDIAGTVYMFEVDDRSGNSDQLTVAGAWANTKLSNVQIPAVTNNSPGTVYLFVRHNDLTWSEPFTFTLSLGSGGLGWGGYQPTIARRRGRR